MGTAFLVGQSGEAAGDLIISLGTGAHIPVTLAASAGTASWGSAVLSRDISTSETANLTVTSTDAIDLTRFSSFYYQFGVNTITGPSRMGFAATNTFSVTEGDYAASADTAAALNGSIDVSSLTGPYYFKFCDTAVPTSKRPRVYWWVLLT